MTLETETRDTDSMANKELFPSCALERPTRKALNP